MSKISVYIGTTGGPVQIERISNEKAPLSEICKGREITALMPISADYENFVQPGRPLERAFGPFTHSSFRMDISDEITSGQSWHLATFIAHGLERDSRLARPNEPVTEIIWLTGKVNVDLQIEPVGHIKQKINSSRNFFEDCEARGEKVSIFIPSSDIATEEFDLIKANNVPEILQRFHIPYNKDIDNFKLASNTKRVNSKISSTVFFSFSRIVSIVFFLALLVYFIPLLFFKNEVEKKEFVDGLFPLNSKPNTKVVESFSEPKTTISKNIKAITKPIQSDKEAFLSSSTKKNPAASIVIYERYAPNNANCADVQFAGRPARLSLVGNNVDGAEDSIHLVSLCGLQFVLSGNKNTGPFVAKLEILSGQYVSQRKKIKKLIFEEQGVLKIDLPRRMNDPFRYQISVTELGGKKNSIKIFHTVTLGE